MNFKAIAQETTTLSSLMNNRQKMKMEEVIANYPDGVTVMEFDFITTNSGTFPVCVIKEEPGIFFFGGSVLAKICEAWAGAYGGDIEKASEELCRAGGVKMKFAPGRTKNGNNITTVEII